MGGCDEEDEGTVVVDGTAWVAALPPEFVAALSAPARASALAAVSAASPAAPDFHVFFFPDEEGDDSVISVG